MRKPKKVLIEYAVDINKEELIRPSEIGGSFDEAGAELIHRVDQEISSEVIDLMIFFRFLTGGYSVSSVPHGHRCIEYFVDDDALTDGSIPAETDIFLEELLFAFLRQLEFENGCGEIVRRIGKIGFGAAKAVMFEI